MTRPPSDGAPASDRDDRRGPVAYHAAYDAARWSLVHLPAGHDGPPPWQTGTHVFVCAALQDPERMRDLTGRALPFAPAVVRGYRRAMLDVGAGPMPFMLPSTDRGDPLPGTVFLGLSDAEVRGVEGYELAGDHRRRVDVEVRVGERLVRAITFVRTGV